MKIVSWLLRLTLFFIVLSFAFRNADPVVVQLIPGSEAELPLVVALLVAFSLGLVCAWLILLPSWLSYKRAKSQYGKSLNKSAEKENIPSEKSISTAPSLKLDAPEGPNGV